jgi:hypothetical protein
MAEKVAGSLSSIITFFLEFLRFEFKQIYGRKLVFYGCFVLLEVIRSLFDQEFEV